MVQREMKFRELEAVILQRAIPERGLRKGDLEADVELYGPDGLDVELMRASGETQALVTLHTDDVRVVRDEEMVSVRSVALGAIAMAQRDSDGNESQK
jgi:Domain of unknown function (DUF4926)